MKAPEHPGLNLLIYLVIFTAGIICAYYLFPQEPKTTEYDTLKIQYIKLEMAIDTLQIKQMKRWDK